jgi:hypothetical protein
MSDADVRLFEQVWSTLWGSEERRPEVTFDGPPRALPSVYDVGAQAAATIATATASVAAVWGKRANEAPRRSWIDRAHAAAACRSERYVEAIGWQIPRVWDPIAGDYPTADGWIRLHTNYAHHREAVLRVLHVDPSREAVAKAVRAWKGDGLETAVVAQGGCAARMRSASEWAQHPQGIAVAAEPLFHAQRHSYAHADMAALGGAPLSGIRVLDLTRVVAGPVCTRFLAAHGADVLRIDPRGFSEVGALLPETTVGKRRAFLDLRAEPDRRTFEGLVSTADVLVHGYRPGALEHLGFGAEWRRLINPSLVDVSLDAYGFTGPWTARRGFDSLLQMSTGIAERGRRAMNTEQPYPLPAQALDHGGGYLMAAAACRGLARRIDEARGSTFQLSLARVAKLLTDLGDDGDIRGPELDFATVDRFRERAATALGAVRRVRCPGNIDGFEPRWTREAGPLGVDPPAWT